MRPSTRRGIARIAFGLGLLGLIASLAALLVGMGLDDADKLASSLSLLVAVLALILAAVLREPRSRAPAAVRETAWSRRRVRLDVLDLLTATSSVADNPHPLMADEQHTDVSTTYVRQRIEVPRPEAGPEPRRPDQHHFLPPGQQPRVIPVRRPLDGTLDTYRHLFLEGGPGSGKSTTAAQLCRQLAKGWLTAEPAASALSGKPVVPILITARQLAEHAALPWAEALAAAVTGALGNRLAQRFSAELLAEPVDGVPWLVIVDGLDEVPSDERTTLIGQLGARAAADDPRYRLLVTSRPLAGAASALFGTALVGHYTLVPFDRALLTEFARRWFETARAADAGEAAARFVAEIRASGLLEVAETPLLARIAIKVYADSPDRTLPRNRHDLYERYLQYLESLNRQRRVAAHAKVIDALDPVHGRSTADGLYDRLEDLIEHLAVERLTSRNPLVPRAVAWLAAHGVPARTPQPLRWTDHVIEALVATGLITRRAGTIDFLHLTFAEHLAARVHARKLADRFDAGDEDWQRWVRRAMEEEHAAGTAVLTRWTREHNPEELLDALLAGARSANLVAVRLVAEGAEVTGSQLVACLAVAEDRVRHGSASRPWDLVARFPTSPVVTEWLRRLVDDRSLAPDTSVALCRVRADRVARSQPEMLARLEELAGSDRPAACVADAARAIVELAPARADQVAAHLTAVAGESFQSPYERVTLATALLDCGEAHHPGAFGLLRSALLDPDAGAGVVRTAAETLVEAGAEERDQIGQTLYDVLAGDRRNAGDRLEAIETLAAIDSRHRARAVTLMHEMAMRDTDSYTAVQAAVKLGRMSPDHRATVLDRLSAIARMPSGYTSERLEAAGQLLLFDPGVSPAAVDAFCAVLLAPDMTLADVTGVAGWLTKVDEGARDLVLRRLGDLRETVARGGRRWQVVTLAVAACDPGRRAEAEATLLGIVARPRRIHDVVAAADLVDLQGPGLTDAMAIGLLAWTSSATLPVAERINLMGQVCRTVPRRARDVVASARELSASPFLTHSERQRLMAVVHRFDPAWRSFVRIPELGRFDRESVLDVHQMLQGLVLEPGTRDEALAMVDTWMTDRTVDVHWRMMIGMRIGQQLPARRDHYHRLIEAVAGERTITGAARAGAVFRIGHQGDSAALRRASSVLAGIAVDRGLAPETRFSAAEDLGYLSPGDARGATALRSLAEDPMVAPGIRCRALKELASSLEPGSPELRSSLLSVLAEAPDEQDDNSSVLGAITVIAPDRRDLAVVHALRGVRHDRWARQQSARLLAGLDGAAALRADLVRLAADDGDCRSLLRAAERASWALPEEDPQVSAALRRVAGDQECASPERAEALLLLATCAERDRRTALRTLRAAARPRPGRREPHLDPLEAATALIGAGPTERRAAGEALAAVLRDAGETTGRRHRAANALIDSRATAHREAVVRVAEPWLSEPADSAVRCDLLVALHRFRPDRREETTAMLAGLLSAAAPDEQLDAAGALLRLDPDHEPALRTLCGLAGTGRVGRAAAGRLLKGTSAHREALADAVHGLLRGNAGPAERVWAATVHCEAVPADRADGAGVLSAVLTDQSAAPRHRIAAARALAGLAGNSPTISAQLRGLLSDEELPAHLRRLAGCLLAELPGPARVGARQDVLHLPDPRERLAAAVSLTEVPGDCRTDALAVLRSLVTDRDLAPAERLQAAEALIEHGERPDRAAAAAGLTVLIDEAKTHGWVRARAYARLHLCGALGCTESVRRLWAVVRDPQADVELRRWSAESLAEIDGTQARHARDTLIALAAGLPDARTGARIRRSARTVDLLGARPG